MRSDPCLVQLVHMRSDPGVLERPSVQLAYARSDPCLVQLAYHFLSSFFSRYTRSDPFPVQLAYTQSDPCPFQLAYYLWSFPVSGWNAFLVLLRQNLNSRSGATATSGAILVIAGRVAELP